MSNYIVTDTELTAVADAIRTKGGTAALIPWQTGTGFADAIGAIPSGGGALPSIISALAGGSFTLSESALLGADLVSAPLGPPAWLRKEERQMTEQALRTRVCARARAWLGRREADGSHRDIGSNLL